MIAGPGESARASGRCWIWGEATDAGGASTQLGMELPEGYHFTVFSALDCVQRVARGRSRPGAWTPSNAFGA